MTRSTVPGAARTRIVTVTTGLRQRAWWVMRRRRAFTLPELLAVVADGHEKDAKRNIGRWLRQLASAGYLKVDGVRVPGTALTSNGFLRYILVRDLGRKAPVVRARHGVVFDPNNGETFPMEGENHA